MDNIKMILWDFDGVLMNSNAIRDLGFEKTLENYPKDQVDELMVFHRANGGLSRYVKFRHFFEKIRGEQIAETAIGEWAERFSKIVKALLIDPNLLITETMNYVGRNHAFVPMHIVSGSDQEELRFVCKQLNIYKYFHTINGSPTPKKTLVKTVLESYNYTSNEIILVGDSVNDYEAAEENGIRFVAYNNAALNKFSAFKINFS